MPGTDHLGLSFLLFKLSIEYLFIYPPFLHGPDTRTRLKHQSVSKILSANFHIMPPLPNSKRPQNILIPKFIFDFTLFSLDVYFH